MKTAIALMTFFLMSTHVIFAGNDPELVREIKNKISVDLSNVELNNYDQDFVSVRFRIEAGEIRILNIDGSLNELKSIMEKELTSMHIESSYEENQTYVCRFTFEKI